MASSPSSSTSNASKPRDLSRAKGSTPVATAIFVGLRSIDVFVQYSLLAHHAANPLLRAIGIPTLPGPLSDGSSGLSALPLKPTILLWCAIGSLVKQNYWIAFISENEMRKGDAAGIAIFNTIFNSLNSIASTVVPVVAPLLPYIAGTVLSWLGLVSFAQPDPDALSPSLLIGATMCAAGLVVETAAEMQRKAFKARPENKGKAFTGGLFSQARHVNYGAYTVWRSGYALAAGGPVWGSLVFAFFFSDFISRGVPVLDSYCSKRYGEQWRLYKTKTPWKLIPGLY